MPLLPALQNTATSIGLRTAASVLAAQGKLADAAALSTYAAASDRGQAFGPVDAQRAANLAAIAGMYSIPGLPTTTVADGIRQSFASQIAQAAATGDFTTMATLTAQRDQLLATLATAPPGTPVGTANPVTATTAPPTTSLGKDALTFAILTSPAWIVWLLLRK